MKEAYAIVGRPPLRRYEHGLSGLARIVVAQQVSAASAAAIWNRLDTAVGSWNADRLLALTEADLRAAGLSLPKLRTVKAVARAIADDELDLEALHSAADEDVRDRLTAVSGIGPWTADIYLLFCLGRADAFAPGDLALMTATAHLLRLEQRPDRTVMEEIAERWRPWRGVAARLLWAWHPRVKSGPLSPK
ncbi:MAG: hypothetical protein RLZ98_752 [Pseudomonadota bacterium]